MATILLRDSAPESYKQKLATFGGKNMYGKPLWRIVRSEYRTHVCGGTFHEGKSGGEFQFRPNGKFDVTALNPGQVHSGVGEILMYPWIGDGWIIERWMPACVWGSREDWDATKADDGQRLFGDYPSEGDYWMLDGPWPELPPMSFLEKTIAVYEYARNNNNQGFEHIYREKIQSEKARAEAKYLKMMDEINAVGREIESVLKGSSLAAQAVRQQAGAARGDRSHQAL